jgi:PAS domain S-box-containing protein
VFVRQDGRIALVNRQAESLFGYTRQEFLGQPIEVLVPAQLRSAHVSHRADFEAHPRIRPMGAGLDLSARRKDGSEFAAEISLSPIKTDHEFFILAAIRDITDRKKIQEELKQLNAGLEQRVLERTAELNAANKELEAFSYSVSHDLRAPLRAMQGFSKILLEEHAPHLHEESQRYLRLIAENCTQMGCLVDDLLTFSRLSRQSLDRRHVSTAALVRQCLEELQPEQEGRSVAIRVGDLPDCRADGSLLRLVWMNLLSNALKFTQKRPKAAIEIGYQNLDGLYAYFVKDNGVGFDMQYADKLFGVFQRLHRAEDYDGTGVGLAIVQRIVHRHGGRVWAEARVDQGATFYFTLEGGSSHD